MKRNPWVAGLVLAAAVFAPPRSGARAQDASPPECDGSGTYAGRDAEWWVGELRGAGTQRVALEALKVIGPRAIPAIAQVIDDHDPVLRTTATGLLRDIQGSLLPARDALGRALEACADGAREIQLLELIARLDADGAPLAPIVAGRLSSPLATVRRSALGALVLTGGDPTVVVPAVRPLLRDEDGSIVSAALTVLARCGPGAADAVPDLLDLLEDVRTPSVRRNDRGSGLCRQVVEALRRIGRVGPRAHAALAALAEDSELGLTQECCQALLEIAAVEPDAADQLLRLTESRLASARSAAVWRLGGLRPLPAPIATHLLGLLDTADNDTAATAAGALRAARVDRSRYLGPLLRRLSRLPPGYRAQGFYDALRGAATEPWLPFVRAIPDDIDPPPQALLEMLAQNAPAIGASDARDALADRLGLWLGPSLRAEEVSAWVDRIFRALRMPARDLVTRLQPYLFGPDGDARAFALRILAGQQDVAAVIGDFLRSDEARQRLRGLDLLQALPGYANEAGVRDLPPLLSDADREIRARAFEVLVTRSSYVIVLRERPAGEREAFCAVLVELLSSPAAGRRAAAVHAVHGIPGGCPKALEGLIEALSDPDPAVDPMLVAGAIVVSAGPDTREVRDRLRRRLEEGGPEVGRAGAALALASMTEEFDAVEKALPGLLASGPWPSLLRAAMAARRLGERARPLEAALCRLTTHPTPCVATEACLALQAVASGSETARRALASVVRSRSSPARVIAISMLASFGGAATEDLVALLEDPQVRTAALGALRDMGPLAHDAVPALEEDLRKHPDDGPLRATLQAIRPR